MLQGGPRHEGVREAVPCLGAVHGRERGVSVDRACLLGVEESRMGVGRRKAVLQVLLHVVVVGDGCAHV